MDNVLVAYATVYGSTGEVAKAIAEALCEGGTTADARPARDVRSLTGCTAVVLGGPLYYFRWHRDANRFLARHRAALEALPVAIFALGPFNDVPEEFDGARDQLDKALAKQSWLSPVSVRVFGGRFDPALLRFPHKVPGLQKMPANDIRDWDAIRAWGAELAESLRSTTEEA